jgi:hypothetical protein
LSGAARSAPISVDHGGDRQDGARSFGAKSGGIQSGLGNMKKPRPTKYIQHHKDGSIWARGQTIDGVATDYWEWFRKDGVRMRSGYFEAGAQVGEWTTYDKKGDVYKVTIMKPKVAAKKTRGKK